MVNKTKNKQDQIVFALETIARLNALKRKNRFKVKALKNAASIIEQLENFNELYQADKLKLVKGIGKAVMNIVHNVMKDKKIIDLDFPTELLDVAELPFIGLLRAKRLYQELAIRNIDDLKEAIGSGKLVKMRGIGEKIHIKIQNSLRIFEENRGKLRLDQALALADLVLPVFRKRKGIIDAVVVGDLRRGCEIISSIDILVIGNIYNAEVQDILVGLRATQISNFVHKNYRGKSGVLKNGVYLRIFKTKENRQGSAQILLTGNDAFLEKIKSLTGKNLRELKSLNAATEKEAFLLLNIAFIPPEMRENGSDLAKQKKSRVKLIELKDLRGTFHNHTIASDGKNSIEQMRDQAIERGLSYISINDHSKAAFYAGGQSEKALFDQLKTIKKINLDKKAKDCFLFSGVESDILYDGSLDYDDKILRKLDIVIASVHSQLKMNALAMTNRMINAAAHPRTTIIGHPTGRRLLRRSESSYDLNAFFEVCKKHNVAVELNAHPERLDLNDRYLAMAKSWGLLIAIDTDAHSLRGLDFLEYGIIVARRAHLTVNDVLNAKPLDELRAWLKRKR